MRAQAETKVSVFFVALPQHFSIDFERKEENDHMEFKVKIRKIIENGKPLKATCSVTMDDMFTVHGVKVIKTEKGSFIAMPYESYKDADGNEQRRDIFHPITSEARRAMEDAVLAAYEAKVAANAAATAEAAVEA